MKLWLKVSLIALILVIGWEKRFFRRQSLAPSTVKQSA